MWQGHNKVWMNYLNNIIAADLYSAVFLSSWMRNSVRTRRYAATLEVMDVQRYRQVRTPSKVHIAIRDHAHEPFVFVVSKN